MSEREEKPDGDGTFILLHQFARHVINCRNMVRVNRVAQAKGVCKQRGTKQRGILHREAKEGKRPREDVERNQKYVDANNLPAQAG